MDVNLFGVLNVPTHMMLHQENQSVIINTGSKQGITNPPGNPAYNASKAAVKSLTESLSHELRSRPQANVTAHLFMCPRMTWTGMTAGTGAARIMEEKAGWCVDGAGDDNETRREVDQLRMLWHAGDLIEGRPALSRWDQTYKSMFDEYVREGLAQLP
ncbi:hypothetical protein EI94DRAFT_1819808 [Lactarius quietus]|nr:hypothetical protein EI94DRAFT_1819808 [Lactarius quietus]